MIFFFLAFNLTQVPQLVDSSVLENKFWAGAISVAGSELRAWSVCERKTRGVREVGKANRHSVALTILLGKTEEAGVHTGTLRVQQTWSLSWVKADSKDAPDNRLPVHAPKAHNIQGCDAQSH